MMRAGSCGILGWLVVLGLSVIACSKSYAQSVCLPMPRLLTLFPMGGNPGSEFEVTLTGENIEDCERLIFSDPGIQAIPVVDDKGIPIANRYRIQIDAQCKVGLVEARVLTRLGISSPRIFSIGTLPETQQVSPNTTLAQAMKLPIPVICNAKMTARAMDFYSFEASEGNRYFIHCDAKGVDSKLEPVVIVANAQGQDIQVERRSGFIDFTAPKSGTFVIKVHELTYRGGPEFFYRLSIQKAELGSLPPVFPATRSVSSFSWPPQGLAEKAALAEVESSDGSLNELSLTLPCDVAGSFFPAADVDGYRFVAKKGEVWWIEVASERLGCPTDPALLVQQKLGEGDQWKDLAELADIASPMKPSSNGYAYDGPPLDAGSPDVLGKFQAPEDGTYRVLVQDLFGGTRNDPSNRYRMVIRQPSPDFALVAWPMHMELRNGDRNALSKPLALRNGLTMALEVVAVRRDGFDGEIELTIEGLPSGVHAHGIKIPSGKTRGILLVTADADAPRGYASCSFVGKARIGEAVVTRPCHMAEMKWPVPDSWNEIPDPRLTADVAVSVSGMEKAPLTIAPADRKVVEVKLGEKVSVPFALSKRTDFSGANFTLKWFGEGWDKSPAWNVSFKEDHVSLPIDPAAAKMKPGEYTIALYGGAVAKYRYLPEMVPIMELKEKTLAQRVADLEAMQKQLAEELGRASDDRKAELQQKQTAVMQDLQRASQDLAASKEQVKQAVARSNPKDIVDIVITEPITLRVIEAESK